jgi:hypothetical protein
MRLSYLAAALAVSCLAGGALGGGGAKAAGYSQACASGYHTDVQGNCQPDVPQVNKFCPPGAIYHPNPGGWYCESASGAKNYY